MNPLILETVNGQTEFRPGETIQGAAYWKLDAPPKFAEVRLFWHARGQGTEDVTVVNVYSFPTAKSEEARPFQFSAPTEPYSFSGQLITLNWGLELVVEPGKHSTQIEITISPTGQKIQLSTAVKS
jgi:hypothetical protein